MAQPGVVVAFSSRCGATETIAHAAAVGTVNARALPRLRRLPDDGRPAAPACTETLHRMRKEYVPPTDADITGSPALIVVPTAGMSPGPTFSPNARLGSPTRSVLPPEVTASRTTVELR